MRRRNIARSCARWLIVCACGFLCGCSRPVEHARRLVDRGTALAEAEQYEEALKLFRMAIDVDPEYEDAYLQMALLFDTYLHDMSNAVVAYEQYLRKTKDETMREHAQRWLERARQSQGWATKKVEQAGRKNEQSEVAEEVAKRDLELEAVRRQTAERYERELGAVKKELQVTQERLRRVEEENLTLRSAGNATTRAELLETLASNREVIARLEKALEEKGRRLQEYEEGQQMLQAMVTNLQAELAMRDGAGSVGEAFRAATNELAELRRLVQERSRQYEESARALATERAARSAVEAQLRQVEKRYEALRLAQGGGGELNVATLAPALAAAGARPRVGPSTERSGAVGAAKEATGLVRANVVVPYDETPMRVGRVYTVQAGDSLMKIARDVYGDGNRWTVIFNANRDLLERPNQLRVGQVLRIP
ncbi:MAG: LysM peptidoglycan-binding domain-containing protein [bacterium]|nr:LysM peptidoglycan-binding domain-containing protein [bacterium]